MGMAGRFSTRRVAAPELVPRAEETVLEGVSWTVFPEAAAEPAPGGGNPLLTDKLLDAKVRLHRRLIEEINLSALEKLPEEEIRGHIQQLVAQYVLVERLALNTQELNDFVSEILDEMTGLGPLEPLLKDQTVNDILINGHECVYVERQGVLEPTGVRFKDETHLLRIINDSVGIRNSVRGTSRTMISRRTDRPTLTRIGPITKPMSRSMPVHSTPQMTWTKLRNQ
jgi:pilus assembly protein CpaF